MTTIGLNEMKNRINRACDRQKPIGDQRKSRITDDFVSGPDGGGRAGGETNVFPVSPVYLSAEGSSVDGSQAWCIQGVNVADL